MKIYCKEIYLCEIQYCALYILTGYIRDLFPALIVPFTSMLLSSRATLLCKPVEPVTIVVN